MSGKIIPDQSGTVLDLSSLSLSKLFILNLRLPERRCVVFIKPSPQVAIRLTTLMANSLHA